MADKKTFDVLIIGAGPAALSAAIYTTREDLNTLLLEKGVIGGLAAITDSVDNYPGFPDGVSGLDLAQKFEAQAKRFGADITFGEVNNIVDEGELKKLETTEGDFYGKSVLITTGTNYKKLGIPGEKEYYGRGIHFCATCDGALYRDKNIIVVGGGNSAIQEALFLTRFVSKIDLLVRSTVKASDVLINELEKNEKIEVHLGVVPEEVLGDGKKVTKVKAKKDGQIVEYPTDGVFVFIGLEPNTKFLENNPAIKLDDRKFVLTNNNLQTGMPGVFAAGDVRSGATMQIASAVGEGATAALKIRKYLEKSNL